MDTQAYSPFFLLIFYIWGKNIGRILSDMSDSADRELKTYHELDSFDYLL